jgi:HSP20 family protein
LWYDSGVAFVRWDPLRDLLAIQQRLNRLSPGPAGWTPPVDLLETPDAYVLSIELAGIDQDEVQLQLRDGRLTIAGARRERKSAFEQYHQIERGHGSFSRQPARGRRGGSHHRRPEGRRADGHLSEVS